jgi:tetratricopeptide (TPR) repeat protein
MVVTCLWATCAAWGQESSPRIIERDPFDVLVVLEQAKEVELRVHPLPLQPRQRPKKAGLNDKIRIRLYEDEENRQFDVFWKDVVTVRFYEEMVLAEAAQLVAQQKFDEAWDYYQFLLQNYPRTPGLENGLHAYWYVNAGAEFKQKRYAVALSILEELLRARPDYTHSEKSPSLFKVLNGIADRLLQEYYEANNYAATRAILARLLASYPAAREQPFASKWADKLAADAARERDIALTQLAARKYTEAYDSMLRMLSIWPDVAGGRELAREISEIYPVLMVGVSSRGDHPDSLRVDHWGDRRTGRLADRRLVEPIGQSVEGGQYASPLGTVERSADGRVLRFLIRPQGDSDLGAYAFSSLLLAGTQESSPGFSSAWAEVFGNVRIVNPQLVEVALKRSHVIPQALPAFSLRSLNLPPSEYARHTGAYERVPGAAKSRFVLPADAPTRAGQPREIQERFYADMPAALLDLQRGQIDCLDRLQPVDVPRVTALPNVKVVRYALPVLHVLVPNPSRPWPQLRTFRRAVMFGLQRENLLRYAVLRESPPAADVPADRPFSIPGAQVISAPFAAPFRADDPNAYAYDPDIKPHPYEPLLSVTLLEVARREAKSLAEGKKQPPPAFTKLVLGHPAAEIPRIACQGIARQLAPLGLPCQLVELDGRTPMPAEVDFVYTELVVSEPTIDVSRIFGPRGLFPAENPHVRLAVRRVERAATWNEASQRLRDLQRVMHEELTVLPLYQTPEFCAFGPNVSNLPAQPLTFYHNVEAWRVVPRGGE